ncbi:ribosomal protein S18-alanine N-acetyltransferase [Defluviimonas sp. WL0024]|uniref:[Ribosomal protein bS18]-alanine N-acetyltransferase n=1 Tax=Albidovulum salinarum TaxID=2984153 RepID=A0ABT2X100_9RHOB|nr:ribosomal protein S18-alanine N-acetyltransferase [Defluviimonas sp. WL0024]MCU9847355.1 ribosomal protein S18-alanine N-acetyltransferase [Defluviimonas sp. WL0024]
MTADPERLAAIHRAAFSHPRPWSATEIAALLTTPGAFLIVEDRGFLIGRAIAGEAELLTVAVAPAARRQGIGARLLAGFLDAARAAGAETAFLEVAADNAAALALYARHGFAETARRRGYYLTPGGSRVDAVLMAARP